MINLFKGGKATKRSRYGTRWKDVMTRTRLSGEMCEKSGLSYHLIDSEMKWHYLPSYEAKELAENSRHVKTVFTFAVRHSKVRTILQQTMRATDEWDKIGLSLVVGNPAFLNKREQDKNTKRMLSEVARAVHQQYPEVEVFVGIESITEEALRIAAEFGFAPFLLLDRETDRQISVVKDCLKDGRVALYFPYLISENYPKLLRDILFRLAGYILRRSWVRREILKLGYEPVLSTLRSVVQEKQPLKPELLDTNLGSFLEKATSTLVAYGNQEVVTGRLQTLARLGVDTVIGLPVKENDEQVLLFGECIRNAANV